jgi:hypothetical protein
VRGRYVTPLCREHPAQAENIGIPVSNRGGRVAADRHGDFEEKAEQTRTRGEQLHGDMQYGISRDHELEEHIQHYITDVSIYLSIKESRR